MKIESVIMLLCGGAVVFAQDDERHDPREGFIKGEEQKRGKKSKKLEKE